jgi:hypothetical protein
VALFGDEIFVQPAGRPVQGNSTFVISSLYPPII